jgi:hypothetical protein
MRQAIPFFDAKSDTFVSKIGLPDEGNRILHTSFSLGIPTKSPQD